MALGDALALPAVQVWFTAVRLEHQSMTPAMTPTMAAARRLALAALLAFAVASTPLRAQDAAAPPPHPDTAYAAHPDDAHPAHVEAVHPEAEHGCLTQKERRAADNGTLIKLSAAMHVAQRRLPGSVVRARLCHGKEGLVYVLTVLAHDGKVARISVDAVKGGPTADR